MTNHRTVLVDITFDRTRRPEPPAERYAAPVRICGHDVAFTLVLTNLRAVSPDGWRFLADAQFLVDHAPHESLVPGTKFELVEGPFVPARGAVLTAPLMLGRSTTVDCPIGTPREEIRAQP